MPELTLDYLVPATVRVNTDTGEVLGATIHTDDFNCVPPDKVFTGCVENLPEYLEPDHPLWEEATDLGNTVYSKSGDIELELGRDKSRFLVRVKFGDDEVRNYAVWAKDENEASTTAIEYAQPLLETEVAGRIRDDVPSDFYDHVIGHRR